MPLTSEPHSIFIASQSWWCSILGEGKCSHLTDLFTVHLFPLTASLCHHTDLEATVRIVHTMPLLMAVENPLRTLVRLAIRNLKGNATSHTVDSLQSLASILYHYAFSQLSALPHATRHHQCRLADQCSVVDECIDC